MNDTEKSKEQLLEELQNLRQQMADLQAAVPLENAWLYEQFRQELADRVRAEEEAVQLSRRFLTLQYAGATIASSLDIQFVLDTFTREMVNLLSVKGCIISEWVPPNDRIVIITGYGLDDWWRQYRVKSACDLEDFPLAKWVLTKRQAQYLTIGQEDIAPADLLYMQSHRIKTLLMLPMEIQNRVIGLVEVIDDEVECAFTTDEIALTQLLANQAAVALENARLYHQARRELTERIEAEKQLRQMAVRNQAILDAIPDWLFYFNREGRLLDYKVRWRDNLPAGGGEDHVERGRNLGEDFCLPSEQADLLQRYIRQTLDRQTVQVFEYQCASATKLLDFEMRLVASGQNEVLAIVRNITERKQAERQVIRAERLAALGQLAAALAHEINNPLQAIQSYLDLMLKYPLKPGEGEEYLQVIRRQIDRVAETTRHVLNFARPQSTPRQKVHLLDLIDQVLVLVRNQSEQSKIRIIVNALPDLPPISGAPDQLTQVFLNLIINAIEANSEQGGQLRIDIYAEKDQVITAFTSDSPPIPPDILSHIFDPFFTTKPDGSGLGLWVSHSLIQQHQGRLTVENLENEQGVVFTVALPGLTS